MFQARQAGGLLALAVLAQSVWILEAGNTSSSTAAKAVGIASLMVSGQNLLPADAAKVVIDQVQQALNVYQMETYPAWLTRDGEERIKVGDCVDRHKEFNIIIRDGDDAERAPFFTVPEFPCGFSAEEVLGRALRLVPPFDAWIIDLLDSYRNAPEEGPMDATLRLELEKEGKAFKETLEKERLKNEQQKRFLLDKKPSEEQLRVVYSINSANRMISEALARYDTFVQPILEQLPPLPVSNAAEGERRNLDRDDFIIREDGPTLKALPEGPDTTFWERTLVPHLADLRRDIPDWDGMSCLPDPEASPEVACMNGFYLRAAAIVQDRIFKRKPDIFGPYDKLTAVNELGYKLAAKQRCLYMRAIRDLRAKGYPKSGEAVERLLREVRKLKVDMDAFWVQLRTLEEARQRVRYTPSRTFHIINDCREALTYRFPDEDSRE